MLDFYVIEGYLIKFDASRELFGSEISAPSSTRRPTSVSTWLMTGLQQMLTPLFITIDMFSLVVQYYFDVFFCSSITMMTSYDSILIQLCLLCLQGSLKGML